MAKPTPVAPLLTHTELQVHFKVSKWTADRWVKDGIPTRILPSGVRRYDLDAVNAWMDELADTAEQSA